MKALSNLGSKTLIKTKPALQELYDKFSTLTNEVASSYLTKFQKQKN